MSDAGAKLDHHEGREGGISRRHSQDKGEAAAHPPKERGEERHRHRRHHHRHKDHKKRPRRHSHESHEADLSTSASSATSDEEEMLENRRKTQKRSRMWMTVSSSDEEGEAKGKDGDRGSKRHSYDSSDDSESSSGDSESRERKRRRKKQHHHRHEDRKRSSERKKEKKGKKDRKKKEKKSKKRSAAVNQNEFGMYGILRESDMFQKQREFELWLREVKGIMEVNGPRWQVMEHFKSFMEDYNTATMPHEKYYDLERWEAAQLAKQQRKLAKKKEKVDFARDEDLKRKQAQEDAERRRIQEDYAALTALNPEKIKAMREQQQLMMQLQLAYRSGNMREAERIKRLLEPDT